VARAKIVRLAKRAGVALKLNHEREARTLRRKAGGYAHARQFKRLKNQASEDDPGHPVAGHTAQDERHFVGGPTELEALDGTGRTHPHPVRQGHWQTLRAARVRGGVHLQGARAADAASSASRRASPSPTSRA
jgi:hypothetical protein